MSFGIRRSLASSAVILAAFAVGIPFPALSAIPEPSAIVYGAIEVDGFPLGANNTVEARLGPDVVASYSIGSNPGAALLYYLTIPLESLDDGGTPSVGVLRVGESIRIYVNGVDTQQDIPIGERAAIIRSDISGVTTTPPDIDSDGVNNWLDNCAGDSNPTQTDTNNNGIGDACEARVNPMAQRVDVDGSTSPNTADAETGFGAVDYDFEIGDTEVTNIQYRDFLQAVAADSDPNGLFNPEMASDPRGGIARDGASPPYSYRVRPNMGDKPVNFVSWLDAARYSNWKAGGSLSGAAGVATLDSGSFDLAGAPSQPEINATFVLESAHRMPDEDEWYKAAYYNPALDTYDDYPTRTSDPTLPQLALADSTGIVLNGILGGDVVNYDNSAAWAAQIGNVTSVTTTLSTSHYGTADQGGNVAEWLANDSESGFRVVRGGAFSSNADALRKNAGSTNRLDVLMDPLYEGPDVGFRMAPEPAVGTSLVAGLLALAGATARRTRQPGSARR